MLKRLSVGLAGAAGLIAAPVFADELLDRVFSSARSSTITTSYAFSRIRTHEQTGSTRKASVEAYNPSQPADARWTLVSVDGHSPSVDDLAKYAKIRQRSRNPYGSLPDLVGKGGVKSGASADHIYYHFSHFSEKTFFFDKRDISSETYGDLSVNIGGKTPFVDKLVLTTPKGFRIGLIASIQYMSSEYRYAMLDDGEVMPLAYSAFIKGSYLGKQGEIRDTVDYRSFRRRP